MDAEQRLAALTDALAEIPGVTPPGADGSRGFGAGALKVDGSIFAMAVQGSLVLKLPAVRVDQLVAAGRCAPFRSGAGRPMREWAEVMAGDPANDIALAREALAYVRSLRRPRA